MQIKMNRHGAVGALLDIYEQAISDLIKVIEDIPNGVLPIIIDPKTTDENCRSLQSILSHVVHSGYGYAASIHNLKGNNITRPAKALHATIKEYKEELDNVVAYTQNIFNGIEDGELEQLDDSLKIKSGWGQRYDIEQLMEHAIVHILRHKRQIVRIKKQHGWD
jgi:uncharacterized damage-inducible protein DinB